MPEIQTPEWVKDAIFYQIFPDRFAKSDAVPKASGLQPWGAPPTPYGYQGGDLLGVAEHLDYLADLGINAIYFNPIFRSGSNHRYHTHDYYQVDPMLGGNAAFRTLLDAAHARGIRVILDGVFNHTSRGFFQFHDILENGPDSAYLDWFTVEDWPLRPYGSKQPNYQCWWGLPALPKFNTATPAVREFIWGVAEYWIKFGIDGWRLDVQQEIDDDEFWRRVSATSQGREPRGVHRGRNLARGPAVAGWRPVRRSDELPLRPRQPRLLRPRDLRSQVPARRLPPPAAAGPRVRQPDRTNAGALRVADHPRPNEHAGQPRHRAFSAPGRRRQVRALRLAMLFQMTMPGAPNIYYGTEIGLNGGHDPDCRRAFPWDEGQWDRDLYNFSKRTIALRHAHPALRRGQFETLYSNDDIYAFARRLDDDRLAVIFNAGAEATEVTLDVYNLLPDGILTDVWGGLPGRVSKEKLRGFVVPPRSAAVFSAR